jgi:hypothetical protein
MNAGQAALRADRRHDSSDGNPSEIFYRLHARDSGMNPRRGEF